MNDDTQYVVIHWTTDAEFQEEAFGPYVADEIDSAIQEYQALPNMAGHFCVAPLYPPGYEPLPASPSKPEPADINPADVLSQTGKRLLAILRESWPSPVSEQTLLAAYANRHGGRKETVEYRLAELVERGFVIAEERDSPRGDFYTLSTKQV